jgi:hypothetical protein
MIFERLNLLMGSCLASEHWIHLSNGEKMDIPVDGKIARYEHLKA